MPGAIPIGISEEISEIIPGIISTVLLGENPASILGEIDHFRQN